MSTQLSGPPSLSDMGLWRWLQNLWQIVTQLANANYVVLSPTTGFSYQVPKGIDQVIIDSGGVLAAGTITLPGNPKDGQLCSVTSRYTITSLTVNAIAGQSVSNAPSTLTTSLTTPFGYTFMFNASRNLWYRVQ